MSTSSRPYILWIPKWVSHVYPAYRQVKHQLKSIPILLEIKANIKLSYVRLYCTWFPFRILQLSNLLILLVANFVPIASTDLHAAFLLFCELAQIMCSEYVTVVSIKFVFGALKYMVVGQPSWHWRNLGKLRERVNWGKLDAHQCMQRCRRG